VHKHPVDVSPNCRKRSSDHLVLVIILTSGKSVFIHVVNNDLVSQYTACSYTAANNELAILRNVVGTLERKT
jgi:hypothetical protein